MSVAFFILGSVMFKGLVVGIVINAIVGSARYISRKLGFRQDNYLFCTFILLLDLVKLINLLM